MTATPATTRELDLGPLAARVPEVLRATSAYHVPVPPKLVAKLDANELPFPLPDELRARLGHVLAEVALERYPDPSARELRAVIAAADHVSPDQLVFGNGSDELIAMLVTAFANGGVLYPWPSFVYYRIAATNRGVRATEVPLDARFELDEPRVVEAIERDRPSVVFLALPNNPTGTLWRMPFALELAARHRDTVIVADEAYLAYSGKTLVDELAAHPNLVILRTLSKIGMAGLRVGYSISSRAIAALLDKVRPPYNLSSLDQRAACFLVREAHEWCASRAAEVVAERRHLASALTDLGFEVFPSEANLILVRTIRDDLWTKLQGAGISVRAFNDPAGPLRNCIRITVGTPNENHALTETLRSLLR